VPGDALDGRPGLSARDGKIASIGVKVDRLGISRHGFALNVQPQMDYWQGIVACGLDGVQMVSMADVLEEVPAMTAVVEAVTREFGATFGVHVVFTHP
jgi:lipoate-protein ligase B